MKGATIMEIGWVQIHRQILGHWIYKRDDYFKAWITILLKVNHRPDKLLIKNKLIDLKRGQSGRSYETWGREFGGWTPSKTRRFLKLLEKDNMIELENVTVTTRLTVCNYNSWQGGRNDNESQVKSKRIASEKQVKTNNNDNKEKNGNKEYVRKAFPILTPYEKIFQMKKPITLEQYKKLNNEYLTEDLESVIAQMENWPPLLKKRESANLTIRHWLKRNKAEKLC